MHKNEIIEEWIPKDIKEINNNKKQRNETPYFWG
jgi:hypothetical protein